MRQFIQHLNPSIAKIPPITTHSMVNPWMRGQFARFALDSLPEYFNSIMWGRGIYREQLELIYQDILKECAQSEEVPPPKEEILVENRNYCVSKIRELQPRLEIFENRIGRRSLRTIAC